MTQAFTQPPQTLRNLAGSAAVALALTTATPASAAGGLQTVDTGGVHGADQADCTNPPHPLLNFCKGANAYRSSLSIAQVQATGDNVNAILSGPFVAKLEGKLRAPAHEARFVESATTLTDPNLLDDPKRAGKPNYYRTVAVIPPASSDNQDLKVCFEGGAAKDSRRTIAIYTIRAEVSNPREDRVIKDERLTQQYAALGPAGCNTFAVSTRDAMNQMLTEKPASAAK